VVSCRSLLFFRVVCCDDFYDVLWCIVDCVGDRVSKRGHFGLVFCSWEEPCTYFEVVVVVFWAFVIAVVFFASECLV
jgi:hypothetical protein